MDGEYLGKRWNHCGLGLGRAHGELMSVLVKQEKTCWSMVLQAAPSSLGLGAIEHTSITQFQMVTLGLELPWMSASS